MTTQDILKTKAVSNAFQQLENTLKKRECEIVFCEIINKDWSKNIGFKILEIKK